MCSFFTINEYCSNQYLAEANILNKRRGPDGTNVLSVFGHTFLHHLLSLTGEFTAQPFVDEQEQLVCLFNGEIYNYQSFGDYPSDGYVLLDLYKKYGEQFVTKLDGEFAIVLYDFSKNIVIASTDVFRTKPLWVGSKGDRFGFCSYQSPLSAMQLKADFLPANTTTIFNLETGEQVRSFPVFNFDVSNQHKTTYDGWTAAFKASITKRSSGQGGNIFVGLSGGYDSGTIVTELLEQKIIFDSYSMYGSENKAVLDARMAQMNNQQLLEISQHQYKTIQNHLLEICEPIYDPTLKKDLRTGKGSVGIYTLCDAANRNGKKIHLSGQGADEIMSDYGIKGKKVGAGTTKSDLAGVFPNDLTKVFPWTNFYKGNQEAFIAINEHVGGAFGIETRYPFLDPALVQEFLWLTPSLKNQEYKAPLQHYLELHNFPYTKEEKTGFSANKSLRG